MKLPPYLPPWSAFEAGIADHLITLRRRGPLAILNYTPKAVYKRVWTPATRAARGLIVNTDTGSVAALPFRKFYNIYWASRGSFEGEAAAAANALWREHYDTSRARDVLGVLYPQVTVLAETLHPATRQVVRYPESRLVIIGARDMTSGYDFPHESLINLGVQLDMPVVQRLDTMDVDALVARVTEYDEHHEGVVLRWDLRRCACAGQADDCAVCEGAWGGYTFRLKLKGAAYARLHRIKSYSTPRHVAKRWATGEVEAWLPYVPEEWRVGVEAVLADLDARGTRALEEAAGWYDRVCADLAPTATQKDFAQAVQALVPPDAHWLLYAQRAGKATAATLRAHIAEMYRKELPPELWDPER